MTERILSPGVFTSENDQSFLAQGIAQIGASFIGPTVKGPAFVPTYVKSFSEFTSKFGPETLESYVPVAVKNYFRSGGTALITRVLGNGGSSFGSSNKLAALVVYTSGSTSQKYIVAGLHPSKNLTDSNLDLSKTTITNGPVDYLRDFVLNLSGSDGVQKSYATSIVATSANYITKTIGSNENNSKVGSTYINTAYPYIISKDFAATFTNYTSSAVTASVGLGTVLFGGISGSVYWANEYIYDYSTGRWTYDYIVNKTTNTKLATLLPAFSSSKATIYNTNFKPTNIAEFKISTSSLYSLNAVGFSTASFLVQSASYYLQNTIGTDSADFSYFPELTSIDNGFLYLYGVYSYYNSTTISNFSVKNSGSLLYTFMTSGTLSYPMLIGGSGASSAVGLNLVTVYTSSNAVVFPDYDAAATPYITSQLSMNPSTGQNTVTDLFRFVHLSDGEYTNTDIKVSITNVIEYSDDETYTDFDVLIRSYNDTDSTPSIIEQYSKVNLNPNSPNFIARVIGDKYQEVTSDNKVVEYGDYTNVSNYVRVDVTKAVSDGVISVNTSPRGFRKVKETYVGFNVSGSAIRMVPPVYKTSQTSGNTYSANVFLGWDFTSKDNANFNKSIPTEDGVQIDSLRADFNVDNLVMTDGSSANYRGSLSAKVDLTGVIGPMPENIQFSVPLQGGSDGVSPARRKLVGGDITTTNVFGYNLSTSTSAGSLKYQQAFDILSNQDAYDMNMLVIPGVIKKLHSSVTDAARTLAETRTDCLYVMDLTDRDASVNEAANLTSGFDSSYVATYYPWVKVLDSATNKIVSVPPSVVIPQAMAYNDKVAAEWWAPAGLNRGGLGGVIDTQIRLSKADRDTLYANRVNPIASFPNTGICIWGQKTLQVKSSALDRINVRRMLIAVRKFIASSSRYLVFENNTVATRNSFLSIVNPYLDQVQQKQGLYAFRVVMDDTNNTPDVIDRNQLVGSIYLQPTKAAEYIVLQFNILPTGAQI